MFRCSYRGRSHTRWYLSIKEHHMLKPGFAHCYYNTPKRERFKLCICYVSLDIWWLFLDGITVVNHSTSGLTGILKKHALTAVKACIQKSCRIDLFSRSLEPEKTVENGKAPGKITWMQSFKADSEISARILHPCLQQCG